MTRIDLTSNTPHRLAEEILSELHARENADNRAGMARFGINPEDTLGVSVPVMRALAAGAKRALGRDAASERHELAAELWASGIHEARMIAGFVDAPELVTGEQMDAWSGEFDSWDVCDQVTADLFWAAQPAWEKAVEYSADKREFVKRTGFVLMVALAHFSREPDERFLGFFPIIEREATDPRNFAKKAVNWALRDLGKRSLALNERAVACAERIAAAGDAVKPATPESRAARWVARDALRELTAEKTLARIKR